MPLDLNEGVYVEGRGRFRSLVGQRVFRFAQSAEYLLPAFDLRQGFFDNRAERLLPRQAGELLELERHPIAVKGIDRT